jgi:hypothetical protein
VPFRIENADTEVLRRLYAMQFQIQNIFDRLGYAKMPVKDGNIQDVRAATLMIWKADIGLNIMLINLLTSPLTGKIPLKKFNELAGTDNPNIPPALYSVKAIDYLRLALTIMFQFRIENMITNILAHFNEQKARLGYLTKVESLLQILSQDDKVLAADKKKALEVLTVLQFIRNSLHNNGYHNNKEFAVVLRNTPFIFTRGEEVKCAGWEHILIAIEESLNVVEEILSSSKVEAIPVGIRTYFVEQ